VASAASAFLTFATLFFAFADRFACVVAAFFIIGAAVSTFRTVIPRANFRTFPIAATFAQFAELTAAPAGIGCLIEVAAPLIGVETAHFFGSAVRFAGARGLITSIAC
jgi:hypothetical protein